MKTRKEDVYKKRIEKVTDRFEAADLLRAFACKKVVMQYQDSPEEKIQLLESFERCAQSLESNFFDDEHSGTEEKHPWRQWLREWGFVMEKD